jgi:hypothetical protein
VAASKCRMRKLEKIATLDQEAGKLRQENDELVGLTLKLKDEVYRLQQELQWHLNNGCQMGGRVTELLSQAERGGGGGNLRHCDVIGGGGSAARRCDGGGNSEAVSPDSTTTGSSSVYSPASCQQDREGEGLSCPAS